MQLKNIHSFVKVAQLGSFHAAAKALHSSQPAISARINSLENELGVQLLERDSSGARLTARGGQLLPLAQKMVALEQEIKAQLKDVQPEKGNLRVGIADTLAHLWLPELLASWQGRLPLMAFEISVDASASLGHQLLQHQLDLALVVGEPQAPELHSQALVEYEQCWVAAPALAAELQASHSGPLSLAELSQQPLLSFPANSQPWLQLQQSLGAAQLEEAQVHCCGTVASLLPMAEQGLGSALLPAPVVASALASGSLQRLEVDTQASPLRFYSAWRRDDERKLAQLLAEVSGQIIANATI
ncbi:MAG: LysR family transcriptional regulator [Cellvibrionaceae bacterium]|nr:LysR family transcriptional regulator [Cellvibrionaceae bacterium]